MGTGVAGAAAAEASAVRLEGSAAGELHGGAPGGLGVGPQADLGAGAAALGGSAGAVGVGGSSVSKSTRIEVSSDSSAESVVLAAWPSHCRLQGRYLWSRYWPLQRERRTPSVQQGVRRWVSRTRVLPCTPGRRLSNSCPAIELLC